MEDFEDLDQFIIEHVTRTVSELKNHDLDGEYKANVLCRNFWGDFEGLHITIGRRIKWLSENNRLPITYIGTGPDNGALYKLK